MPPATARGRQAAPDRPAAVTDRTAEPRSDANTAASAGEVPRARPVRATVRPPRHRGLRATFGPERVAAMLVVLLVAVAVPVAFGVTAPPQRTSTVTPTPPPSSSAPASSTPSPSASPGASAEPTFSPAVLARIQNVLAQNGRVFRDGQELEAELAKGAAARPELLRGLITETNGDAFDGIGQSSGLRQTGGLGDLPTRLLDRYEEIRAAAKLSLNGAARDRAIQEESARLVIAAIATLRPLDEELQAVLGPAPS